MKSTSAVISMLIGALLLTGCHLLSGRIKVGDASVVGVKDAGKPATLATTSAGVSVALPEGSKVIVTKSEAVAPTKETLAQPAKEVTEIIPSGPTEYHKTEATVKADTGTVDTSIATKRIEVAESRPLLYAAIAAALAAGVFVYLQYPTPAICCGIASVVFFLAWKLSGLPDWFYVIGAVAIVGGVMLYIGHERGLYTPVPTDKLNPPKA